MNHCCLISSVCSQKIGRGRRQQSRQLITSIKISNGRSHCCCEGFLGSNPKLQEYFLNAKPVNPGIRQPKEVCVCVCVEVVVGVKFWREASRLVLSALIKSMMHKIPGCQKASGGSGRPGGCTL